MNKQIFEPRYWKIEPLRITQTKETELLDTFLAEQIAKELYDEKARDISNYKISTKKQIKELELKQPKFTFEPVKKIFKQASASQKSGFN